MGEFHADEPVRGRSGTGSSTALHIRGFLSAAWGLRPPGPAGSASGPAGSANQIRQAFVTISVAERSVAERQALLAGCPSAGTSTRTGLTARENLVAGTKLVAEALLAAALLLVALPALLLVALAIKIESRGPVCYRALRVGHRGDPLTVLKFRKMRAGTSGPPVTAAGDERFTRIGAFLARRRIDEIPQLWHVMRGQMSLVGPRPEDPRFVALYQDAYQEILTVRPGLSGWTQLIFRDESKLIGDGDPVHRYVDDLLPEKVRLDRLYAGNRRLTTDFKLLLWTPLVMFCRFDVEYDGQKKQFRLVRHSSVRRPPARPSPVPRTSAVPTERRQDRGCCRAPPNFSSAPDVMSRHAPRTGWTSTGAENRGAENWEYR
ncbi:sugar transferase [Protofrankia symbiont of Coriaria ruscifolia]|uniref:sugar transferase n=1 Tax=Protofrankia symbiont of Coriaria ruscifolia TaxID=1306542 RepID=UPI001F5F9D91|nr:sugar transferase [Protofrankia symbiont of Coriaria ruscifolia]